MKTLSFITKSLFIASVFDIFILLCTIIAISSGQNVAHTPFFDYQIRAIMTILK
jgi:hypothetical protein